MIYLLIFHSHTFCLTIKDELYLKCVFWIVWFLYRTVFLCFIPIYLIYHVRCLNDETSLTKEVLTSDFHKQLGKISAALPLPCHSCKCYNAVSVIDQLDHLAYATPGGVTLQGFADTLFNQLSQEAEFNTDRNLRFSLNIHKSELIWIKSHLSTWHNYEISKLSICRGSEDT